MTVDLCLHLESEPVELSTGEVVGSVCVSCLVYLPPWWGCNDCEYVDLGAWGTVSITRKLAHPCSRHAAPVESQIGRFLPEGLERSGL